MELDQIQTLKGKRQVTRRLGSGSHKDKGKEELAENNTRGSLGC
jgi:hypothetical protein